MTEHRLTKAAFTRFVYCAAALLFFHLLFALTAGGQTDPITGSEFDRLIEAQHLDIQNKLETLFPESEGFQVTGPLDPLFDTDRIPSRLLGTSIDCYGDIRVINLYVPNGQTVGSDKYEYKLAWLDALRDYLADELAKYPKVAVMGDFNIAPDDRDVHDPDAWRDRILCSVSERERLQALSALGFVDSFRLFDPPDGTFSWWDYRAAAFRRKRGLRIDLILVSPKLAELCSASQVDSEPRKLERPSDHAPVFAEFD